MEAQVLGADAGASERMCGTPALIGVLGADAGARVRGVWRRVEARGSGT